MRSTLILFLLSIGGFAGAQEKKQDLLFQLNNILRNTTHHHWAYEGLKMQIDSPFTLKNGVLSMHVRYYSDTAAYWERMEAPLDKIHSVWEDVYVILLYKKDDVIVTGGEVGRPETTVSGTRKIFHVGLPSTTGTADSLRHVLGSLLGKKEILPQSEYFRAYEVDDSSFSEGLKLVQLEDRYGYIDTARMVVIPFRFDEAMEFSEGLAAVSIDRRWGYIDRKGRMVIPVQFSDATDFVNGKAEVFYRDSWYSITKSGRKKKLRGN